MTERVYLLLGSNEGDRWQLLRDASESLAEEAAKGPVQTSNVFETAAWGLESQPPFLNMALGFDTELQPSELLEVIKAIELRHGRQREVMWGQRTLDIDILLFGGRVVEAPELAIPHPRLPERRFALAPLAEIAEEFIHPIYHIAISELLQLCPDQLHVQSLGPLHAEGDQEVTPHCNE